MQEDKAVTHQFSLALTHNLHKPLSTCGMVHQHLAGAGLGFKFLLITVHTIIRPQTHQFLNIFLCSMLEHTLWTGLSFCLVQLESVRHTPPTNTDHCHELCTTMVHFDWICSWLGTHHCQYHSRILDVLTASAPHLLDSVDTHLHTLASVACKHGLTVIRLFYDDS